MKQVFAKGGAVRIEDVPVPVCGDNEVLVANAYSAISVGTEIAGIIGSKRTSFLNVLKNPALIKKALKYMKKKGVKKTVGVAKEKRAAQFPLGYSCSGTVIAVGKNVTEIAVGDKVACAGAERASHAEVVAVPRNLVANVPDEVGFNEAAFATLGAIAMHGIRRAGGQFGETVAVLGVGLLGQLAVQMAKAAGCKVIAIDTRLERVDLAKRLGADLGLVAGKHDLENEVLYYTDGIGADAVIVYAATSSSEPVKQAMEMCRKKGKIVVVGAVGMELSREPFYEKELDFLISRSYGPGRYDPLYEEKGVDYPLQYVRWTENRNMQAFLGLLKEKKVDIKPLVSTVFSIEEAEKAYDLLFAGEKRPLGILLKYDPSKYFAATGKVALGKRAVEISPRVVEGRINVAVIGAGNFARDVLLPVMTQISDYNLRTVATKTGINAKRTASKFNAEYCTTDYMEALEDKDVDLVVITTPHSLHYPMIVDAAKAGKAVYVEKPMCLTEEELEEIVKVVSETKVPLVVGFNRRYAPLAVKAKELMKQKHGPYLINYRVNAGYIPKTHWVQDPEVGGGRIIGECCHFFDFFNYFIDADVETMNVTHIPVNESTVVAQDNLVATIRWADGSLTTLTYTALGHADLPKERTEIFGEGNSIVIDDFKEMKLHGFKEKSIKLKNQDKGHRRELVELSKFLRGRESNIISFSDSVKAMEITFRANKLLRKISKGSVTKQ